MSWKKKYKRDWLNWRRYFVGKWEMVKLGEISSLITKGTTPTTLGYSFQDSGINFVKIESLTETGEFIPDKFQFISEECNQKLKRSMLEKNDILFSIAGALGRVAIVTDKILPANTNQALAIIRISCTKVYLKYATYALKSNYVFEQFQKQKQGVAQLNLSLRNIGDIEIPLPPLDIQQKIANILDMSSAALEKRRDQIDKLDLPIKSQFIEMFGDPVTNPKGWGRNTLNSITDVKDGTHDSPKYVEAGYPLLTSKNFTKGFVDFSDVNYISKNDFDLINKRSKVDTGDIVMPMIGTIGCPVIVGLNAEFAIKNVALIKFIDKNLNNIYLQTLLSTHFLEYSIKKNNRGGTQKFIALGDIRKLKIPMPPISLQNQFASFVQQVEIQKSLLQKSLDKLEVNHKSLMQKAFRGELF